MASPIQFLLQPKELEIIDEKLDRIIVLLERLCKEDVAQKMSHIPVMASTATDKTVRKPVVKNFTVEKSE